MEGVGLLQELAILVPVPAELSPTSDVGDGENESPVEEAEPRGVEHGIAWDLVCAVAVKQRWIGSVQLNALAVDDRHRHPHPVGGGGPQSSGLIFGTVVAAAHRLLLDDCALARVHVVVDRGPGSCKRCVVEAHHGAVVDRVRACVGGVRGVGLLDKVQLASFAVEDLEPLEAVGSLPEHNVIDVNVGRVEPDARPLGDELCPLIFAGIVERRGDQPKVAGAVIGEDHEAVALMVDRVLDAAAPGLD